MALPVGEDLQVGKTIPHVRLLGIVDGHEDFVGEGELFDVAREGWVGKEGAREERPVLGWSDGKAGAWQGPGGGGGAGTGWVAGWEQEPWVG